MAKLKKETLKYLTKLSRIACTEDEEEKLLGNLEAILAYIEQLKEVDTEGVVPCNHVLENIYNVMREDEVGECMPREDFLANAPSHTGGMIRVPPVFKENN